MYQITEDLKSLFNSHRINYSFTKTEVALLNGKGNNVSFNNVSQIIEPIHVFVYHLSLHKAIFGSSMLLIACRVNCGLGHYCLKTVNCPTRM